MSDSIAFVNWVMTDMPMFMFSQTPKQWMLPPIWETHATVLSDLEDIFLATECKVTAYIQRESLESRM